MDQKGKKTSVNAVWNNLDDTLKVNTVANDEKLFSKPRNVSHQKSNKNILKNTQDFKDNPQKGCKNFKKFSKYDARNSEYSNFQKKGKKENKPSQQLDTQGYLKEEQGYRASTHSYKSKPTRNENAQRENKCFDVPHPKRNIKPMSFSQVQNLTTRNTSEVLLTVLNKESGFSLLLDQKIKRDLMAYILIALGKAVSSYMSNNVAAMIHCITNNSNFFLINIQQYLVSFQMHKSDPYHLDSLVSLSEFLYKFQVSLPANASDMLLILLPLLKQTCDRYLLDCKKLYCLVTERFQEIEEQNKVFFEKHNLNEIKQSSHKEKLQLMDPPENYRSIPVLPNIEDILQPCTFLRPNIVKGQYQNAEHYLDVQYRLLREDYVKPLRDGIAEYLRLIKQGKSVKLCKDVKVYPDVHIVKQEFVNGGLVHIAYFNDKNFNRIKWEFSKRFLSGSLLCLSSDDFQTMLFATVAQREPKELSKGLLLLRFEELTDEVLNINPLRNFVVIETSAYFEAYRHNLNALLQLDEETLPLKHYIVEAQKNIQKPQYLDENVTFDMRPLLLPLDSTYIKKQIRFRGKDCTNYEFPINISEKAKSVNVLNENCWPSCSELKLDPSQYTALKAAITKEFAVIQGPPGTGKTFVGLRIAQLLIHNVNKWQTDTKQLPILVICYTNHALDQFLEGILLFTKKLVRVGGRGINEAISRFQLHNLKREIKAKREIPHYIFSNIKQKYSELHGLRKELDNIRNKSERSFTSVLSENILVNCMSSTHFSSLKSMNCYLKDDGFLIHDWLGIRVRHGFVEEQCYTMFENPQTVFDWVHDIAPIVDEHIPMENFEDIEGEADIEYIEAQRDINSDEFADVSYDIPAYENENDYVPIFQTDWQMQGGKRQLRHYISHNLENSHIMLENEAMKIHNVWELHIKQRWRLYKFWLNSYIQMKEEEGLALQQQLRKEYEELCEMRTEEDIHVCKQAHVVGMTTTGAAKYRHIVQHLNPKVLIVEEAAEILESHIVTSLAAGTQHVILIGDHQQLRPSPTVHLLAVKYDLNVSLFERMVNNGLDCYKLGIQHRMRPEIATLLVPHIYNDLKDHESVTKYENIKGVSKNVFFITHSCNELQEFDSKSKVNQHEARFMMKLCKYLILQGYDSSQITVLTTYSGQLFELKRLCGQGFLQGVKFTVVDNYQGEENDIILISFVRSNEEGEIGFLKVSNRVCVALSRAKKGLFCIGNFELLAEKSELWKNIVHKLEENKAIGPSLQLLCQNHPGVSNIVATEKDFDSVPEGGCTRKCELRLPCGHVCPLMCHPYDVGHVDIACQKPCNKLCSEGHQCQNKCSQLCKPCTILVEKTLEVCKHTKKVLCYRKKDDIICTELCDKYLPCGHMCTKKCSAPCVVKCIEKIKVKSEVCGHKVIIECYDYENTELLIKKCREPCRVELSCGHMCNGSCSRCHQGRLHVACNQPCKRILVCGHECKSPCSDSCPPCEHQCENQCIHSKCPKICGEPCEKCTEPCEWSCAHKKCTRLCGEQCDRTACDEPCRILLECEHQCIGLCGEPCPKECRVCDKEKVREIFFGSEDEKDSIFMCLEDCKHIFELNGITQWMNTDHREKNEIQMKVCPKCKRVIRKNLRFGNIVKSCLADIEKVKRITYGDAKQNIKLQEALLQRLKKAGKTWKLALICKPVIEVLMSGRSRSIQTITTMENSINILLSLLDATQFINSEIPLSCSDAAVQDLVTNLKSYLKTTKKWLTVFIQHEFLTASGQQLQELTWEVHRLKLANNLLKLIQQRAGIKSSLVLNNLVECIITNAPFNEKEANKFILDFKSFVEIIDGALINVSELEKQSILKAMGLSKGHWYQCPNGHVYCITECGGAIQESHCNECGEIIGGLNHIVLSSNRVATAMDGSQYPAWSDAMNMENYRF